MNLVRALQIVRSQPVNKLGLGECINLVETIHDDNTFSKEEFNDLIIAIKDKYIIFAGDNNKLIIMTILDRIKNIYKI